MAIAYRRIIDQLDDTELQSGDYIMVDSETEGTRKYDLGAGMSGKVDKVTGKGLSTEDYTTAEKTKLSEVEAQANKTIIDATLANTGQAADAKKVGDELSAVKEDLSDIEEEIQDIEPLSEDAKAAFLNCFRHVAWIDEHGQTYYDALYDALYPDTGLVRIEAVFNQGTNMIYEDTPLNDLKAYLTVTGYYNDGTSKRIKDFTLSGVLTVGTSTITVFAGEKMSTFSILVTAYQTIKVFIGKGISGTAIVDNPKRALTEPIPFENVVPITVQRTVADDGYRYAPRYCKDSQTISVIPIGEAWRPGDSEKPEGLDNGWLYSSNVQTWSDAQDQHIIYGGETNNTFRLLFAPYESLSSDLPENAPMGYVIVQGVKYKLEEGSNNEFV